MQDFLTITLADSPGELLRVLALIERRRFTIRGVQTEAGRELGTMTLNVTVTSEGRNVLSLTDQIQNLADVVDGAHTPQSDLPTEAGRERNR